VTLVRDDRILGAAAGVGPWLARLAGFG
jgi:hypothetical protein